MAPYWYLKFGPARGEGFRPGVSRFPLERDGQDVREAYIAAYEGTGERRFLDRVRHIAGRITVDFAARTGGLLWEHYTADWKHNFAYNADEPRHQFRPPGYQPGHHVEWAKLLGLLDRYGDDAGAGTDWAYDRAVELFEAALEMGWTGDGFVYTVDEDGTTIVPDRYGWALAEALGAAAVLEERAGVRDAVDQRERFGDWRGRFIETIPRFVGPASGTRSGAHPQTVGRRFHRTPWASNLITTRRVRTTRTIARSGGWSQASRSDCECGLGS